jgi:hypothetical protein
LSRSGHETGKRATIDIVDFEGDLDFGGGGSKHTNPTVYSFYESRKFVKLNVSSTETGWSAGAASICIDANSCMVFSLMATFARADDLSLVYWRRQLLRGTDSFPGQVIKKRLNHE